MNKLILEDDLQVSANECKSGVLGVDSKDKIFLVNKSSLELIEYDASKLIGRSIFDLLQI